MEVLVSLWLVIPLLHCIKVCRVYLLQELLPQIQDIIEEDDGFIVSRCLGMIDLDAPEIKLVHMLDRYHKELTFNPLYPLINDSGLVIFVL